MIPTTFWTAERVAILKARRHERWTARAIAALLGCTRNAVIGKAGRLGLPPVLHEAGRPATTGARRRTRTRASGERRVVRAQTRRRIDFAATADEPVSLRLSIVAADGHAC